MLQPREDQEAAELTRLLRAGHPLISIRTFEEHRAVELVRRCWLGSDRDLVLWSVSRGLHDGRFAEGTTGAIDKTEHPAAALYYLAHRQEHPVVAVMLDLGAHLEDERTLRVLREGITTFANRRSTLILVDHRDQLPPVIDAAAVHFELMLPNAEELEEIVRATLQRLHREAPITVELRRSQLETVVGNLRGLTHSQAERVIADCVAEDRRFDENDIGHILTLKRQMVAGRSGNPLLTFVETPESLDGIGGLQRLKKWLLKRRHGFGEKAAEFGLTPPRGVLLIGVQGAGKSLCAKAAAAAWHLPLLRLDPGSLYDRYVGESERRLREALSQTERMAPVILWIDEIEKGFASAASHSTDGGLSQRMFGTLLTWMQEHESPVFLFATANDIEALPPELLRKGRFDEIFFVDLPGAAVRRDILSIHLKRRRRDPRQFDLDHLAAISEGFSGAEIEQAVVSALHEAYAHGSELRTSHLESALKSSPPISVTMAERIEDLRAWAQGRCVMAD